MVMLTVFGCRSNLANSDETLVASSVLMKLLLKGISDGESGHYPPAVR
jgi:hypothetical protein